MSPAHARAAEVAAIAGRLRADLASLSASLDAYRGASGFEAMRTRSLTTQAALEAIASRIVALGPAAAPSLYALSEAEHTSLEAAGNLRDRLAESLSRYQRSASRAPIPLRAI